MTCGSRGASSDVEVVDHDRAAAQDPAEAARLGLDVVERVHADAMAGWRIGPRLELGDVGVRLRVGAGVAAAGHEVRRSGREDPHDDAAGVDPDLTRPRRHDDHRAAGDLGSLVAGAHGDRGVRGRQQHHVLVDLVVAPQAVALAGEGEHETAALAPDVPGPGSVRRDLVGLELRELEVLRRRRTVLPARPSGAWLAAIAGRVRRTAWCVSSRSEEVVEPRRIVDQDPRAGRFVGGERGEQVDQVAIVGNLPHVGVRPVGAPEHSVGCRAITARANGTTSP